MREPSAERSLRTVFFRSGGAELLCQSRLSFVGKFHRGHTAEVFWLSRIDALDQSPDLLSDNLLTVETLIDSRRNTEIWIRNDYCVNVFTKYMDCKFWVEGRNGRLLVRARYYDAINTGDYETVNYFFPISELVFRPDHVYVMKNGQIEDVDLFAAGRIKAELLS